MTRGLTEQQIAASLVRDYGMDARKARAVAAQQFRGTRDQPTPVDAVRILNGVETAQPDPAITAPIHARRTGDTLWLSLQLAPRTKKNHTNLGIGQSKPYRRFRDGLIEAVNAIKDAMALPLPDQWYNIAVTYYVDGYGRPSDRPGLDQGLFDALQDAGVISNDWLFRQTDGTRIVLGDLVPRIELTISPIPTQE